MRVIIANSFVYPFHHGGIEKRVYHLAKALIEQGIGVEVVTCLPEDGRRREIYDGIPYTFIPPRIEELNSSISFYDSSSLALFSFNLARYLGRQKFDVLHAHGSNPYFYLRRRTRFPVVFQPFEEMYEFKYTTNESRNPIRTLRKGLFQKLRSHVGRYCMTHASAIASEGDFQTEIFMKLFGVERDRIFDLPVAVGLDSIDKILRQKKLSRQEIGLRDNDFVLISVNRLQPYKGFNYLIEAFRLIKQRAPNAALIMVGSGPEEERLKKQILNYGLQESFIHLKNVPEEKLYQLYALSDIYVSPTLDTGSVQSVIEAMGCGLPVVSTGQDFWIKSGQNGYVVPKKDPQAIARAVLDICERGKGKEFGDMSRRVAQDYSYRAVARKAIEKYEELLS